MVELLNIKFMEAKEILKALSKAGMVEKGDICMGKWLKKSHTNYRKRSYKQSERIFIHL